MKITAYSIAEVISFLLVAGNLGVIENEICPPLQVYLLVALGVVLMILFGQLIYIEKKRGEKRKGK